MLKLLIAVDNSEHARRAIEAAARLAREAVAVEAVLLNVREPPGFYGELPPLDMDSIDHRQQDAQHSLLEAALVQARAAGLREARSQGVLGHPAREIARAAADMGADLVVMGTRGMNPLGGLLLGSVAQRAVHLLSVPVLLVK